MNYISSSSHTVIDISLHSIQMIRYAMRTEYAPRKIGFYTFINMSIKI